MVIRQYDPRFSTRNDPRFEQWEPKKKKAAAKTQKVVDQRFTKKLGSGSFASTYTTDAKGRELPKAQRKRGKAAVISLDPTAAAKRTRKAKLLAEEDWIQEESNSEKEDIPNPSSEESDATDDEERDNMFSDDEEDEEGHIPGEQDEEAWSVSSVAEGADEDVSNRLALQACDWDHISAEDIYHMTTAALPSGGRLDSVSIYPTPEGEQRLQDEENGIFPFKSKEEARKYELERLKFHYAVLVFDSKETARQVYEAMDGSEIASTGISIDFRFVPDDVSFDEDVPKAVCTALRPNYKPPASFAHQAAWKSSTFDVSWDAKDEERAKTLMKAFNEDMLKDSIDRDVEAYLASSSDESEDKEKSIEEKRKRIRDKYAKILAEAEATLDSDREEGEEEGEEGEERADKDSGSELEAGTDDSDNEDDVPEGWNDGELEEEEPPVMEMSFNVVDKEKVKDALKANERRGKVTAGQVITEKRREKVKETKKERKQLLKEEHEREKDPEKLEKRAEAIAAAMEGTRMQHLDEVDQLQPKLSWKDRQKQRKKEVAEQRQAKRQRRIADALEASGRAMPAKIRDQNERAAEAIEVDPRFLDRMATKPEFAIDFTSSHVPKDQERELRAVATKAVRRRGELRR